MTDCEIDHFQETSADNVCDICHRAYCYKCGEKDANLCKKCKVLVLKYCKLEDDKIHKIIDAVRHFDQYESGWEWLKDRLSNILEED